MMVCIQLCLDPLSHHQPKLDPLLQNFLDPRMQLGNYALCAKSAFMRRGHHVLPDS